jgi:hypothetical protein
MSIKLGKYQFEGPYTSVNSLDDRSGVYAILCYNGQYRVIDIGESAEVKTRVTNHDRQGCWTRNCTSTLAYAVYYTSYLQQSGRMAIEQELRKLYDPPCGKQ